MVRMEDEVLEDLQRDGLKLLQKADGFKFGIDAVLLSHFVECKPGQVVYDLGTGTGIIPVLLSALTPAGRIVGIELQPDMAEMAQRSVRMNGLDERVRIVEMDIKAAPSVLGRSSADVVVSNPPYFKKSSAIRNPADAKAIARHEVALSLEELVQSAAALLRPGGNLFLIHRPHRLVDLLCLLRREGLEPKTLRFVSPKADKAPNLFLLRASRGGRPDLKVLDPLVIYDDEGGYTETVRRLYGHL